MSKFVAYYRVATKRQEESGLGLEAQRADVARYLREGDVLLAEYAEVETANRDAIDNRPLLLDALAHARTTQATLVVANLDCLTRSVAVTSMLHQTNVDFVCCDNPTASRLEIQILSAVLEDESRRLSHEIKSALKAYKARGGILGATRIASRNLKPTDQLKGSSAGNVRIAILKKEAYEDVTPRIQALRADGLTLRAITETLNLEGLTTRRGHAWNHSQVARLLKAA